jgi:hypothetical protein
MMKRNKYPALETQLQRAFITPAMSQDSQPSIASTSQDASAAPIPHTMRMAHNYPGSSYTLPADSEEMIR